VIHRLIPAALALAAVLVTGAPVYAQGAGVNLPDIGSPANAVLNKNAESRLGRQIMAQLRATGQVNDDPLLTEYINEIGHRIAPHANDGEHSFEFFVVENPAINAFALPGGYIGVHTGLIQATRNEDELAGVLAHEVAHVTQRHIARAIHANQRQSILSMAMMLGAILAGAAGGDSDAMQGAIAVAQGTALQQQINFTRQHEYEADRVGIEALYEAGFDPDGMASFFEVISRSTRPHEYRIPEFLRTHPVSSNRIAEARNRARSMPAVPSEPSVGYGIAKARAWVESFERSGQAVEYYERQDYEQQSDADRYGRALAYLRDGRPNDALPICEELANRQSDVIAYHICLGEAELALEDFDGAIGVFERAQALFPRNVPLVIHHAQALIRLGQPAKAHEMLLDLLNTVPPTPEQVRLIARAADLAGENAEARYYMAEYRFMIGDLVGGVQFLRQALADPGLEEIQRIRFQARIDEIQEYMTEEQLQQMRRARTMGG